MFFLYIYFVFQSAFNFKMKIKNLLLLKTKDNKNNIALLLFTFYCMLLLIIRAKITNSIFLFFLIWNLFLAFVPYGMIMYLKTKLSFQNSKIKIVIYLLIWLLFLPNTFYIITDFVHLSDSNSLLFWFDLLLLLSFSIVGFALGLLSLIGFEKIIKIFFSHKLVQFVMLLICILCGLGIYLGRIKRFNSWDVLQHPFRLTYSTIKILESSEVLLFSIQFGLFIYFFYQLKQFLFNYNNN